MTDGQYLARAAKEDLLMGEQAWESDRMHRYPFDRTTPGSGDEFARYHSAPLIGIRSGNPRRRRSGRPGRGVCLPVVVQFNDLGSLEMRSRQLRETHHQDGPNREIGNDQTVRWAAAPEHLHSLDPVLGEPGRANDSVYTHLVPGRQVVHHHIGIGELNDHVTALNRFGMNRDRLRSDRPARRIEQTTNNKFRILFDRGYNCATHATRCTRNANFQHHRNLSTSSASKGPTTPNTRGPANTAWATSYTSSAVTAFNLAIRSSIERCSIPCLLYTS